MLKYDVTGVGLNLGSGEEFVRKTGMPLPAGREAEQAGVWVLGLIKVRLVFTPHSEYILASDPTSSPNKACHLMGA